LGAEHSGSNEGKVGDTLLPAMPQIQQVISQNLVNELYLTVLPMIHLRDGLTEQVLTLTPDKSFASEFFPDEVETYVKFFQNRTQHLVGGHVTGYTLTPERTAQGLYVVRVTQNVR
jgi:hypothetical protein